jgi:hypothetical protein
VVEDFVLGLAADFRQKVLELPRLICQNLPTDFQKLNKLELVDCIEKTTDVWLLELSQTEIKPPQPERIKGAYTSRPGPKQKRNPPKKPPHDTHFRAAI